MFYVNKEQELNIELLQKMINRFRLNVEPKLTKYKNYYDGLQAILHKSYSDTTKPCNKTITNYCKNIVDSYSGYMATPNCISYKSENDIEEEIGARFNAAVEEGIDETDIYADMLEIGIDVDMVRRNTDDETADHMEKYCREHGLLQLV